MWHAYWASYTLGEPSPRQGNHCAFSSTSVEDALLYA